MIGLLKKASITITSGRGAPFIKITFEELKDAQALHQILVEMKYGVPRKDSTADLDIRDKLQKGTP